jgi:hypothetical protein
MLELLINGEAVDLLPEATISIEEESPVFEKDSIPGGFSFPFDLPVNPRNNRILGHAGRIQSARQGGVDLPFQFFNNGRLFATGTLTVQKASHNIYSAFLTVGSGDFAGKIAGKKLSDVDFGGIRVWEFKPEYTYPEDDFALFPVYNPVFMDNTEYKTLWGYYSNRLNSYEYNSWYYPAPGSIIAISPFPFVAYVLKTIFNQFGFQVNDSVFDTDPDLNSLVIYTNRDLATYVPLVTIINTIVFDTRSGEWAPHNQPSKSSTMTPAFDSWNLKDFLPDMLISDFILAIRNLFNLSITIDNQGAVSIRKRNDLLTSENIETLDSKVSAKPLVTMVTPADGVYLKWEHEPNDTLFSDGFKDVYSEPTLLGLPVDTIVELENLDPKINDIRLIKTYAQYYQYSGKEVDGVTTYKWKFFSNDFQNLKIGNGKEEFTSKSSTLPMFQYKRLDDGPTIRCPHAEQLSSSILRSESLPCSLRFLFYRGMVEDSNGTLYPYGSSDAFGPNGAKLSNASLSLRWDSNTGLYNQLWKDYLTWWSQRKMVTWTIADPSALNFTTIYAINGNQYLLKKRGYSIKSDGVQPGECEFYLI